MRGKLRSKFTKRGAGDASAAAPAAAPARGRRDSDEGEMASAQRVQGQKQRRLSNVSQSELAAIQELLKGGASTDTASFKQKVRERRSSFQSEFEKGLSEEAKQRAEEARVKRREEQEEKQKQLALINSSIAQYNAKLREEKVSGAAGDSQPGTSQSITPLKMRPDISSKAAPQEGQSFLKRVETASALVHILAVQEAASPQGLKALVNLGGKKAGQGDEDSATGSSAPGKMRTPPAEAQGVASLAQSVSDFLTGRGGGDEEAAPNADAAPAGSAPEAASDEAAPAADLAVDGATEDGSFKDGSFTQPIAKQATKKSTLESRAHEAARRANGVFISNVEHAALQKLLKRIDDLRLAAASKTDHAAI